MHARADALITALAKNRRIRPRPEPDASNIRHLEMPQSLADAAFERGRLAGVRIARWQDGAVPIFANRTILRRSVDEHVRLFTG